MTALSIVQIMTKKIFRIQARTLGFGVGILLVIFGGLPLITYLIDRAFPIYSEVKDPLVFQSGNLIVFSGTFSKYQNCIVEDGRSGRVAVYWHVGKAESARFVPLLEYNAQPRDSGNLYQAGDEIFVTFAWDKSSVAEARVIERFAIHIPCRRFFFHETMAIIGDWSMENVQLSSKRL